MRFITIISLSFFGVLSVSANSPEDVLAGKIVFNPYPKN